MPPRKSSAAPEKTYSDFIQPFLIDHSAIRGRLVRVGKSITAILAAHRYPRAVGELLAEQLVLASLLSATLEGEGVLTVQAKGDGPVRFVVVDVLAGGIVRGYADYDEDALGGFAPGETLDIGQLLGKGYLAVTLDPGGDAQRYQGIVELRGKSLSDAFRGYFIQSQQAEIAVHVAVRAPDKARKRWTAGGIIIERMPLEGGHESEFTQEEQDELWRRTGIFMRTLKDREMLDDNVTPQNLLYRLFNEDGVWVYKVQPLKAGCRCSRPRVSMVLKSLPQEELLAALDEKGRLGVYCQFCNKKETFTRAQVNRLYRKPVSRQKAK